MSIPTIKLHKLPDTKPTKHTITVMPDLEADLEAYAKVLNRPRRALRARLRH